MNTAVFDECKKLSLEGKISFPDVVKRLAASGTERYVVDLIGMQSRYYSVKDECYTSPMHFKGPKVATNFNATGVKDAIREIQQQKMDYPTFLTKIMEAGCSHYEVFIAGRNVMYFGRDGSHHIERFP